jgi:hypothetical protein
MLNLLPQQEKGMTKFVIPLQNNVSNQGVTVYCAYTVKSSSGMVVKLYGV